MHYNGANSYLYVNDKEIQKFTAKDSIIVPNNSYLGKTSKDWSKDNITKQDLMVTFMILVLIIVLLQFLI